MSVDSILAAGRARWEATARATCTIVRPPTDATSGYDYDAFTSTPAASTTVYTGWCHLSPVTESVRDVQAGGELVTTPRYRLHIAADADVQVDDIVTVTAQYDDDLTGRPLHVVSVEHDPLQVTRTAIVQDDIGDG